MKAILEFDLNEPEDVVAHKRAVKALDLILALWDMDQYLRSQTKYAPDSMSSEVWDALADVREKLHEIKTEYNISFDELLK